MPPPPKKKTAKQNKTKQRKASLPRSGQFLNSKSKMATTLRLIDP